MIKVTRGLIPLIFALLVLTSESFAQNKKSNLGKISCAEKWWVVSHPFIAKKTYNLTRYARTVADSVKKSDVLDGDISGGQVDAFKHAYWMAILSQNIRWKAALRLGKAHEKGNYKSHKKGVRKRQVETHDRVSSEMDMWNNHRGIEIGKKYTDLSRASTKQMVIDSIQTGVMRIIWKNSEKEFLDCDGQVIPTKNHLGKWKNDKCLVPSNQNKY